MSNITPKPPDSIAFSCSNLSKFFESREEDLHALQDVSFSVAQGEFACVVGPSGCGKSTLLRIVAGLIEKTSGELYFKPQTNVKPQTSMVFQDQGLFPWMTVLKNAALGLEMQGISKVEREAAAAFFLEKFGLKNFLNAYPHILSGGMRQRVALSRAFLSDPEILLMDEPFGMLDAQTRIVMQEELLTIWQERRHTVLYITHDIEEAIFLGSRILVMSGRPGRILEDIPVNFPRPRKRENIVKATIDIRHHIWDLLHDEVVKELDSSDGYEN